MKKIKYVLITLVILFLAGFATLFNNYITVEYVNAAETFTDIHPNAPASTSIISPVPNCPDLLIRNGNSLLLYDTKKPSHKNHPMIFNDLDEYTKYVEEQKKNGNNCPILFLQKENDAQNNEVYRMRPTPFFIEGGLPPLPIETYDSSANTPIQVMDASVENGYNQNMYPAFDPTSLYVGRFTNIDEIHQSTNSPNGSHNPADDNWKGVIDTQKAVDMGLFKENEVYKLIQPNLSK